MQPHLGAVEVDAISPAVFVDMNAQIILGNLDAAHGDGESRAEVRTRLRVISRLNCNFGGQGFAGHDALRRDV